jgi:thymidine phosphorylase
MSFERLRARRAGIDTYQQPVVYMRGDCPVCRAEGFEAQAQVEVIANGRHLLAILHHVSSDWLGSHEIALSEVAWTLLGAAAGDEVEVRHPPVLASLAHLRAKVHGARLDYSALRELMEDVSRGRLSDIHLASLVTVCAGGGLDLDETVALTQAMVDVGERIDWGASPVMDKHCIGGLPGNRTTLLVVPIVAACGVLMPKTSSRAITSAAGTADAMETLAPVELDLVAMRRVVAREGGCIAWGGATRISPADDMLIRVERPLNLDSEGLLGSGQALARDVLDDGRALATFLAICEAQGGLRVPPRAAHTEDVIAHACGTVSAIDTRLISRAAKLAGAPRDPAAGARMHVRARDHVELGQPLFTLHAGSPGALQYALRFLRSQLPVVHIDALS